MKSYPQVQSSPSETQEDFMRLVEGRTGTYHADDFDLPGDTVRFSVAASDSDEDVSERRHTVAFLALNREGRWKEVGSVRHSLKEIETLRHVLVESTFEITGFQIPQGLFARTTVERVVQDYVDRLEVVRLLPASARGA